MRLKRVRNIQANPNVVLLLDHYEEDWESLWYVLIVGLATLLAEGEEHQKAIELLKAKYNQYLDMDIEMNPVIKITPQKVTTWTSRLT